MEEALSLDLANGTTAWSDSVTKEMTNNRVAFDILEGDRKIPIGYQFIRCQMIFDIKLEDFSRKARFVAGGHMTETPKSITYASVVSRDSVRIALTIAALNDLEIVSSDIQNAYLTAPCAEKVWIECGDEFGRDKGRRAIIVRALYGLKSSGAAFVNHLRSCMRELGFSPCTADNNVWLRAATKPSGEACYEYVLLYVDDILAIGIEP